MKSFWAVPVFLVILHLVEIHGRHVEGEEYETPEEEEQTEVAGRMRDRSYQMRHHRRSRQMLSYDYPPPLYYDYRRDYSFRHQEEYLSRILKSLDEIVGYIRRPPQPAPQPIYIPYPVVQYRPCSRPSYRPDTDRPDTDRPDAGRPDISTKKPDINETTTSIPNLTDRWPVMDDENQNWGLGPVELPEIDEDTDGTRPISFDPVQPNRPTSRPPPPVEHGSNQAGMEQSTAAPVRRPGACETAILTCCSIQDRTSQKNCFARYDCIKTYSTNRACDPSVIKRVLDHFSKAYSPVKKD